MRTRGDLFRICHHVALTRFGGGPYIRPARGTSRAPGFWLGAVAQLGERLVRNEEVSGSIPLSATRLRRAAAETATAKRASAKTGPLVLSGFALASHFSEMKGNAC